MCTIFLTRSVKLELLQLPLFVVLFEIDFFALILCAYVSVYK